MLKRSSTKKYKLDARGVWNSFLVFLNSLLVIKTIFFLKWSFVENITTAIKKVEFIFTVLWESRKRQFVLSTGFYVIYKVCFKIVTIIDLITKTHMACLILSLAMLFVGYETMGSCPAQISWMISVLKLTKKTWLTKLRHKDCYYHLTLVINYPLSFTPGTGIYYLGLLDANYNRKPKNSYLANNLSYTLRIQWTQCLYWDDIHEWKSDGCSPQQESDSQKINCR